MTEFHTENTDLLARPAEPSASATSPFPDALKTDEAAPSPRATAPRPAQLPPPSVFSTPLFRKGLFASILWSISAATYLLTAVAFGNVFFASPAALGGVIAGFFMPLAFIWLIVSVVQRGLETDQVVRPLRQQLNALLAPGAAHDVRMRRAAQLLADQTKRLKEAADIAIDDSSSAMTALSKQSSELRRLSAEAMLEIGSVTKTAENTLQSLHENLSKIAADSTSGTSKLGDIAATYEKRIKDLYAQVEGLATSYEKRLTDLSSVSETIETKAKSLLTSKLTLSQDMENTAEAVSEDLSRLETILAEVGQRSAAIAHQLARPVESLENAANKLDQNMKDTHQRLTESTELLSGIGDTTIARASGLVSSLSDRLSALELVGAKMVSAESAVRSDTSKLMGAVGDIKQEIVKNSEITADILDSALTRASDIGKASHATADALASALADNAARIEGATQASQLLIDDLKATNSTLAAEVDQLSTRQKDLLSQIDMAERVASMLADLEGTLETRTHALKAAATDSAHILEAATGQLEAVTEQSLEAGKTIAAQTADLSTMGETLRQQMVTLAADAESKTDMLDHMRATLARGMADLSDLASRQAAQTQGAAHALETQIKSLDDIASQTYAATGAALDAMDQLHEKSTTVASALEATQTTVLAEVEKAEAAQTTLETIASSSSAALENLHTRIADDLVMLTAQLERLSSKTDLAGQDLSRQASAAILTEETLTRLQQKAMEATRLLHLEKQHLEQSIAQVGALSEATAKQTAHAAETMARDVATLDASNSQTEALLAKIETQALAASGAADTTTLKVQNLSENLVRFETTLRVLNHESDMLGTSLDHHATAASLAVARTQEAAGQMDGVLSALAAQMQAFARVSRDEQEHLQDWLKELAASAGTLDIVGQEARTHLEAAQDLLAKNQEALLMGGHDARKVLTSASEDMQEAALILAQQAQASAQALGAATSGITGAHLAAQEDAAKTQATLSRLNSDMLDLTRLMDALSARSEDLSAKLSTHSNAAENATSRLQSATQVVGEASEKLEGRMSSLLALSTREASTLSLQADDVARAEHKLLASTQDAQEALQGMVDRLAQTTLQAGELLDTAQSKLAAAETQLTTASAQGQLGYGSLAAEIQKMSASINSQLDDTRTTLAAAEEQFGSMGALISRQSGEVDERLLALMNSTNDTQATLETSATTLLNLGSALKALLDQVAMRMSDMDAYGQSVAQQTQLLEAAGQEVIRQKDIATQSLGDVQAQLDDISSSMALLTAAILSANEAGSESRMGADLLATEAKALISQLNDLTTTLEQRQHTLNHAAEETVARLMLVGDGLRESATQAATEHDALLNRAKQTEHVMSGLVEIAGMSSTMVDESTLRMASMAGSIASETARLEALTKNFTAQEANIREAAQTATAVLQMAESQFRQTNETGLEALQQTESQILTSAQTLQERLENLATQTQETQSTLDAATLKLADTSADLMSVGQQVAADLLLKSDVMGNAAQDLAATGHRLDREMKLRLENIAATETAISSTLSRCAGELTTLDSAMRTCLAHLGNEGEDLRKRLATEIDQLQALPQTLAAAQAQLLSQMESAHNDLMLLKDSIMATSQSVIGEVATLTETGLPLAQSLKDIRQESQLAAEQIKLSTADIASQTEELSVQLRSTIRAGLNELTSVKDELRRSEGQALSTVVAAREQVETLTQRIEYLGGFVTDTAALTETRYKAVTEQSHNLISELAEKMDIGADRLEQVTGIARQGFTESLALISSQEREIIEEAKQLVSELAGIRGQLTGFGTTLSGLDERLETVGPTLEIQQSYLSQFLSAIDRTMSKINHLEERAEDLASSHLAIAKELEHEETKLLTLSNTLTARLSDFKNTDTELVSHQLQKIAAEAEHVQNRMLSLSDQAGKLDQAISTVRAAIGEETEMLEAAENRLGITADLTGNKLRKATEVLGETLEQVEKSAHLSQLSLGQTGEETQRMVVRLEQIRALMKTMMTSVSGDLNNWQSDIRAQIQEVSAKIQSQIEEKRRLAGLMPLTSAATAPTGSPAALTRGGEAASSTPFFTQLADEALHALAVDLYRVLHSEVPDLRQDLPDTGRSRGPMTPQEARAHTDRLISRDSRMLRESIRTLYLKNNDFRNHADRYLTRFELQYDVLARNKDSLDAASKWRDGPHGQLYRQLSQAIERRTKLATMSSEGAL